ARRNGTDALAKAGAAVQVVEPDRDTRLRPLGNYVVRRVADFQLGDLDVRGLKPLRPLVELQGVEFRQHGNEAWDRVVGQVRIGDVALSPGNLEEDVHRPAPTDLHHVAE